MSDRADTYPDGNLTRHTRPDGSYVDYAWNARNLLSSVTSDAPPPLATYTYNGRNQIASHVVESGLFTATRSYDAAGRLTGVSNNTLDSTSYTLSPDGRRTGIDRNGSAETYGYDNARQVTSSALPLTGGTTTQSWNYDAAGNRSTATTNGSTTSYTANSVNAYTAISGGGFTPPNPTYDANGNLLTGTVLPLGSSSLTSCVFAWNINNELISATNGTGDSATYQYDAFGRRTQRTETIGSVTTTTWFLTNGWNVELEHNGSSYISRHTWGLDLSGSMQGAGGVGGLVMTEALPSGGGTPVPFFPTYDGNGNITAWVNASGSVIARQRYDAYGSLIEQTGTPPSNYGFSTKPQEKVTGFHYYGYRFYDADHGRWPSRDPIEEEGGINLYRAINNTGVNGTDFLGLEVTRDATIGISQLIKNVEDWEKSAFAGNPDTSCNDRLKAFRDTVHNNAKFGSGGSGSPDIDFGPSDTKKLGWHYLYTSEGWIDFGHFSNAAYYQQKVGVLTTKVGGHLVESLQGYSNIVPGYPTAAKTSAFTREDYRSNRLGAEFGEFLDRMEFFRLFGGCKCKSLSSALYVFLLDYNPSDNPEAAPNFIELPLTQDELDSRGYIENWATASKNFFKNGIPDASTTLLWRSSPANK